MPTAYLIYDRKAIAPKGADRPRRGRIGVIAKIAADRSVSEDRGGSE
jgi:hypothetical protein